MRKRTQNRLFANIFWYFIYLLPLIIYCFYCFRNGSFVSISSMFNNMGLSILEDNVIFSSLSSMFGVNGILPFFASNDILIYFTYFASVSIIRLFIDFLLFIPNLCRKFMLYFYQEED